MNTKNLVSTMAGAIIVAALDKDLKKPSSAFLVAVTSLMGGFANIVASCPLIPSLYRPVDYAVCTLSVASAAITTPVASLAAAREVHNFKEVLDKTSVYEQIEQALANSKSIRSENQVFYLHNAAMFNTDMEVGHDTVRFRCQSVYNSSRPVTAVLRANSDILSNRSGKSLKKELAQTVGRVAKGFQTRKGGKGDRFETGTPFGVYSIY